VLRLSRSPSTSRRVLLASIIALALVAIAPPADNARAAGPVADVVVATARALVGSPYAYIGDDPGAGFSCIGFVHYVYARVGVDVPYSLGLAYGTEPRVSFARLRPGDLVFFSNTVWNGLSHVALYVGGGQIIGADTYTTGVEVTALSDPYWLAHYTGATRPLAAFDTLKLPPTATPPTAMPRPTTAPPPAATPRPTATPSPAATMATPLPARAPERGLHIGALLRAGIAGNIYSGPGYAYPRIDRLPSRASLRIAGVQGAWANVAYQTDGTEYDGWVDGPYLAHCTLMPGSSGPRRR